MALTIAGGVLGVSWVLGVRRLTLITLSRGRELTLGLAC